MEQLIADSLSKSTNVHKAIKTFQQGLSEPASSRIITRVKNMQLALIKNEYLNVYREHSVFVEKYEEKLKKILKREAQISESSRQCLIVHWFNLLFSVAEHVNRRVWAPADQCRNDAVTVCWQCKEKLEAPLKVKIIFVFILDPRRNAQSSKRAAGDHPTAQLTNKFREIASRSLRDVCANINARDGARIADTSYRIRNWKRAAERRQRRRSTRASARPANKGAEEENLHFDLAGDCFRSFNSDSAICVNKNWR